MGLLFGRFWSRFLSTRSGRTQSRTNTLDSIQRRLHALVLKNGEVHFLRQGDLYLDQVTEDLTLVFQTLGGDTWQVSVRADPRLTILGVIPLTLKKEYDVAAVGDIPVLHPSLLRMCFEDLADESLTLKLTVLKASKEEATHGVPAKRRKLCPTAELAASDDDTDDAIWEQIFAAYRREMSASVMVDDEDLLTTTPFLVSKLMMDPIDILIRNRKDTDGRIRTAQWTLVKIEDPLTGISSGSTCAWRTIQAKESKRGGVVCLQCIGHDSNSRSFDLRLCALGPLWSSERP